MAEDKKSALIYADIIHTIEKLVKLENGKDKVAELFITILEYINDRNPVPSDPIVEIAFEPIKQQFKRDLKSWEGTKKGRSEAGKVGGKKSAEAKASKGKQNQAIVEIVENSKQIKQGQANQAVTDTVTVNVNDSVSEIENTRAENLETYRKDLPNSKIFENIARTLFIPKDQLLTFIPDFDKSCKVSYPNFSEYCNHFKFVVAKKLREQNAPSGIVLKTPFPKR